MWMSVHLLPEDIEDMTLASDGEIHVPALPGTAGPSRSEARRLIEGGGVRIGSGFSSWGSRPPGR